MLISSLQIAIKIRDKIQSNQQAYASLQIRTFSLVENMSDNFIRSFGLSPEELVSCNPEKLARIIIDFASNEGTHENPDFKNVYILLQIFLAIESVDLNLLIEQKIKTFLKLFKTGENAEKFIICFHENPGLSLKDKLPLTDDMLKAVQQLNLISPHANFDILVDQFINESTNSSASAENFVFFGVNSTATIKELKGFQINNKFIDITILETRMRPAPHRNDEGWSVAGFLGAHESLIDVLARDNEFVVDSLNLTHQMLAAPLRAIMYIFNNNKSLPPEHMMRNPLTFMMGGYNFEASYIATRGWQSSPFGDELTGSKDFEIKNIDNGKSIKFGELVPELIHRYGFYEGDTPYRVDPKVILEVFDSLFKPQVQQTAKPALNRF